MKRKRMIKNVFFHKVVILLTVLCTAAGMLQPQMLLAGEAEYLEKAAAVNAQEYFMQQESDEPEGWWEAAETDQDQEEETSEQQKPEPEAEYEGSGTTEAAEFKEESSSEESKAAEESNSGENNSEENSSGETGSAEESTKEAASEETVTEETSKPEESESENISKTEEAQSEEEPESEETTEEESESETETKASALALVYTNAYLAQMSAQDQEMLGMANCYLTGENGNFVSYSLNAYQPAQNGEEFYPAEDETGNLFWQEAFGWCMYYGYPGLHEGLVNPLTDARETFAQRAISFYEIPESLAIDAVRLATQIAICYLADSGFAYIRYGICEEFDPEDADCDPVFYLAGDIAALANENAASLSGVEGTVYQSESSYLLSSNMQDPEVVNLQVRKSMLLLSGAKAYSPGSNAITITGQKTLEGKELKAGQFTFILRDSKGNELQRVTNKVDGSIVFDPLVFSGGQSGTFTYTVEELNDNQKNIEYDSTVHTVRVAVESGIVSEDYLSDKYYGFTSATNTFYMGKNEGSPDFPVYCLDVSKNAPVGNGKFWVAQVDPTEAILQASVTKSTGSSGYTRYYAYDGWADDLKTNLKKILYYFYLHPNDYNKNYQQQIIWMMTNGTAYSKASNRQIILNLIAQTEDPVGMELVLFHPEDGTYQPMLALVPTGSVIRKEMEPADFTNYYVGTPSGYELPETGGSGSGAWRLTGSGILLFGTALLAVRKIRMRRKQERRLK